MKLKAVLKRSAIVVVLIGFVFFVSFIIVPGLRGSAKVAALSLGTATSLSKQAKVSATPVRLKTSKINVDAAIDPMGLTSNGDMEAPAGPSDVGWYRFGPQPGANGSAVIDGHYGRWANGQGSVFDNLSKLKKGDSLDVIDQKGMTATFVVRESRTYDPKADTSDIFKSNDGTAHLNLITCDGAWNAAVKSYSKRLVVFADKN